MYKIPFGGCSETLYWDGKSDICKVVGFCFEQPYKLDEVVLVTPYARLTARDIINTYLENQKLMKKVKKIEKTVKKGKVIRDCQFRPEKVSQDLEVGKNTKVDVFTNEKGELTYETNVDGKRVNVLDMDVFDEVLEKGATALQEALAILKKTKTLEAKEWVKKYGKFAK